MSRPCIRVVCIVCLIMPCVLSQGRREDGVPIAVERLTDKADGSRCEVRFQVLYSQLVTRTHAVSRTTSPYTLHKSAQMR